jgi:hypothetical protein
MANGKKRSVRNGSKTHTLVVRHPVQVTVQPLMIEPSGSLAYLDVAKLAKATRAHIELGHVTVNGCKSAVRAIVRKGVVVGIATDGCAGCDDGEGVPAEILPLLRAAQRKLRAADKSAGEDRPVPVAEFLQRQQQMPERSRCFMFCIFGRCYICCGFLSDLTTFSCGRVGRSFDRL